MYAICCLIHQLHLLARSIGYSRRFDIMFYMPYKLKCCLSFIQTKNLKNIDINNAIMLRKTFINISMHK